MTDIADEGICSPMQDAPRLQTFDPFLNKRPAWGGDASLAVACAFAVVVVILSTWPFGGLPYNDDFSYSFTARVLAQTGELRYNGWAAAALGPQALWGALFIKLFGFSFTAIRLSTLPVAAACGALAYALARLCGMRRYLAVLSTMVLVSSPLFIMLSASFLTDIGGLLFTLAALYCVISSGVSRSRSATVGWIIAVVILVLAGGMVRQIVWMVALAGLPCLAWFRRKQMLIAAVAVAGWLTVLVGIVVTMRWLSRQPYFIPEDSISSLIAITRAHPERFVASAIGLVLTLILFSFPIVPTLLPSLPKPAWWQIGLSTLAFVGILLLRTHWVAPKTAPWLGNTLTWQGPMGTIELGPGRPPLMSGTPWLIISMSVYAVLAISIGAVARALKSATGVRWIERAKSISNSQWPMVVFATFTMGYCVLLMPRCLLGQAYDRYLLPLYPCVTIPALLLFQHSKIERRSIGRATVVAGWLGVVMFAGFGIATTQEVLSLGRARLAVADEIRITGVPRQRIDAGFEYDFWTQLLDWGYVNEKRMKLPVGAYKPALEDCPIEHCPVINPLYSVEFKDRPLVATERATSFPSRTYLSLWPPFHRTLVVRKMLVPIHRKPK